MSRSLLAILILISSSSVAQNKGLVAKFNFNNGNLKDDVSSIVAKTVGVTLTEDRFGNSMSAFYFHGNAGSYINLGTSNLLKPANATISLWLKMDNMVYSGKGFEASPIITTKAYPGNDFYEGYAITCEFYSRKLSIVSSYVTPDDSIQAGVYSKAAIKNGQWYHVVMFYDDTEIGLYVNGMLQNKVQKKFRTQFLPGDSVILGYTANIKNVRFFNGSIDDIEIYNRVLSPKEVSSLYHAEDPNSKINAIKWLATILTCAVGVVFIMFLLLRRERIRNRRQRQLYGMEVQIMRAHMNPHFIFNALNSLQQFILENDNRKAHKYLVKFSRLLKMILENTQTNNISLKNEIDLLTQYIEIEALRFGRTFSYQISADAQIDIARVNIPQMLIQPIVENAIWHGLLPKECDRRLTIKFEHVNMYTVSCTIDDNGVGRNSKRTNGRAIEKKSLALGFIQQRLKLMSKELNKNYFIDIIDKAAIDHNNSGTSVIIKLPILN